MDIWEQQKNSIEYAKMLGLDVKNIDFLDNSVPAVEVKKRCFVALCDSRRYKRKRMIKYLTREIAQDEMDEIIYLATSYFGDGIHTLSEVVDCAEANNIDKPLFPREIYDYWDGYILDDDSIIEYRKNYLTFQKIEWHVIENNMLERLISLL